MQYKKENALKPITVALGFTATKSTSRQFTLPKISAEAGVKEKVMTAGTRGGLRLGFKLGTQVALSGTILAGPGVGVYILVEGPILARGIYKLHRKKKFEQISEAEYTRGVIQETFTSVNVIAGSVGGAILGQILIPIPGVGAGIGGVIGTIAGQAAGKAEGLAASKLVREKISTLPVIANYTFTDIPSP